MTEEDVWQGYAGCMRVENEIAKGDEPPVLLLSARFTSAVDYARTLHIERRKGSEIPYMAHLLGVAALVMAEAGHAAVPVTEDMVIAALLHDAAEDHGGAARLRDIDYNFGSNVARMVEGLSDSLEEDPNKKGSWKERKLGYIERLRCEPADTRIISAADKLYNARAMLEDYREVGPEVLKRFKRGRNDQIWYLRALLQVFRSRGVNRLVEELARVVDELESLSEHEENGRA